VGGDHGKGGEEGRVKREVGTGGDTRRIAHLLYQDGILPLRREDFDIPLASHLSSPGNLEDILLLLNSLYTSHPPRLLVSSLNGYCKNHQRRPTPPQGSLQACRSVPLSPDPHTPFVSVLTLLQMMSAIPLPVNFVPLALRLMSSSGIASPPSTAMRPLWTTSPSNSATRPTSSQRQQSSGAGWLIAHGAS
jgi:hypothetical protein